MLVHVVSRPLPDACTLSRAGLGRLVDGLRSSGVTTTDDTAPLRGLDLSSAVARTAEDLRSSWRGQPPDLVHAFGLVATMAAVEARTGDVQVVATFDERPVPGALEQRVAARVDALVAPSSAERVRWRRRGIRHVAAGTLGVAVSVPDPTACAAGGGHVVAAAGGHTLDVLLESMRYWAPARLVLVAPVGARRWQEVRTRAAELGVPHRIEWRPDCHGTEREEMWSGAALAVAGMQYARHAEFVLEAAAHGVPAVAVADDAHLDVVVPGATGVLVAPGAGARDLGHAIGSLLADPFRGRGYGAAALVRAGAMHTPDAAGRRLLGTYERVMVSARPATPPPTDPDPGGSVRPGRLTEERAALALEYLPLARQLAQRYAGRGQNMDDLVQVASLGLLKAAERFDPDLGSEFHSFAIPTILGELRRHFRDHAWVVRVPRSLQEATMQVQHASDALQQERGRDASAAAVADQLGMLENEVRQAWRTRNEAMSSQSLDLRVGEAGNDVVGDLVGGPDPELDRVEEQEALREALRRLPPREREILVLRFFGERTQTEIAEALGMSQVHVSRLLTRTLTTLRDHVLHEAPLPTSWPAGQRVRAVPRR